MSILINTAKAKGATGLLARARSIYERYGINPGKMDQALLKYTQVLEPFHCGATFPITAVTLSRNRATLAKYLDKNIEFAVHGFRHIDYAQRAALDFPLHLRRALDEFAELGISPTGYRSPYLSRNSALLPVIGAAGFSYVSNQPLIWDVVERDALSQKQLLHYDRALAFYKPWKASKGISLPRMHGNLIEIPVSLPDDEILVERLGSTSEFIANAWCKILNLTYQEEGLFTLQLHPERISACANALVQLLGTTMHRKPAIWLARLDEIATWWRARCTATLTITPSGEGRWRVMVDGPPGTTVLVRDCEPEAPSLPWMDGYARVDARDFYVSCSPGSDSDWKHFEQAQASDCPLIRLGNWPDGCRSALSITGDIDAMTIWDYGLRLLGK